MKRKKNSFTLNPRVYSDAASETAEAVQPRFLMRSRHTNKQTLRGDHDALNADDDSMSVW